MLAETGEDYGTDCESNGAGAFFRLKEKIKEKREKEKQKKEKSRGEKQKEE